MRGTCSSSEVGCDVAHDSPTVADGSLESNFASECRKTRSGGCTRYWAMISLLTTDMSGRPAVGGRVHGCDWLGFR
ncbi:hypothetical protein RHA1_ro02922 [Rhodococcus jostii RHA1]|uniref:Uncharacterized protein n=1 Tax=Rhodococcus jostii (strain RHA1) TaxID=101510 RepID=Q0SCK9_RHOJR|nr:hypothetical protein RHA1_ro02922 [Rhodococcus jostii RHA1]